MKRSMTMFLSTTWIAIWLMLVVLPTGGEGSGNNNNIIGGKARIVEWELPQHYDDYEETELDEIPNNLSSSKPTQRNNNNNREFSSLSSSPFSLDLHLEEQQEQQYLDQFTITNNDYNLNWPQPQQQQQQQQQSINNIFNNGFNNNMINNNNRMKIKYKKTGTTIAGCICGGDNNQDGEGRQYVVLAADTRATESTIVADKRCQKLHPLATNSWCAGAGTSADLDHLTKECLYTLALQKIQESNIGNERPQVQVQLNTSKNTTTDDDDDDDPPLLLLHPVSIDTICNFFQDALYEANGNLGANLILGCVWNGQAHLRAIHPHGSMDKDLPFAALGSGGLAAMGVLEQGYKGSSSMTLEDGIDLVKRAIVAGIKNDLGSGSQVDLCIIYPDGTSRMERCVVPEEELLLSDTTTKSFSSTLLSTEEEEEEEKGGDSGGGVNGFGNLPFAIQSKKTIYSNSIEEERLSKWNTILGL